MRSGQNLTDMFFRKLSTLPIGRAFFGGEGVWLGFCVSNGISSGETVMIPKAA